jgi:zinc D-Ala-D-Ala carboxypeptidase
VDDTGLPQIGDDLPELSTLPTQDIPAAVREANQPAHPSKPFKPKLALWGLGSLAGIAALAGSIWLLRQPAETAVLSPLAPQAETTTGNVTAATGALASPTASPNQLLGHLPYAEAPKAELRSVAGYGAIRLRSAAATKLEAMIDAAAKDGVELVPLSGFRTVEEQNSLFFDVKAQRGEVAAKRAAVSAPPGYSEHHTGYAVDLGDGDAPNADLQFDFDQTAAYKWLKENAAFYSFELSFPKDNPMGVSYEPWHWRFVGDRQSLETFYKARTDATARPNPGATPASNGDATSEAAPKSQPGSQSKPQSN